MCVCKHVYVSMSRVSDQNGVSLLYIIVDIYHSSLGVNMGSNSIPLKIPSDESINRGLVCAYMHFIARTQKILTFMS